MSEITQIIKIRDYVADDINFIYATWLNGFYYGNEENKKLIGKQKTLFFTNHQDKINKFFLREGHVVKISCLKDDDSIIVGFFAYEKKDESNILNFVFVKNGFRKMGVAKMMSPDNILYVTHLTKIGKSINKWEYIPHLFY